MNIIEIPSDPVLRAGKCYRMTAQNGDYGIDIRWWPVVASMEHVMQSVQRAVQLWPDVYQRWAMISSATLIQTCAHRALKREAGGVTVPMREEVDA